jgi:transcriptional regulator with PAS, ATPase and Fis domain
MPAPHTPTSLPQDANEVLRLAAQSMFDIFAQTALGMMVVDRQHRIVWISEGYKHFLPALGFACEQEFVGKPVEEVVPNTLMNQVIDSGRPIVLDLLTNKAGTFLVSRLPLRDEAGQVLGAVGMVWLNESPDHSHGTMQPLMAKFSRLQKELDDARRELAAQRRPKYTIASFIGASPAVMEVKRQARRVAGTDSTVLLLGETGTGKELMAQGIHASGHRAGRPFVGVNIAAVPDTLLEAEFFGVAPGAYTGADRKGRPGKFKLADGGTLFLDEIGDMPLTLQAKLLRVLQEQEVEPLGSNRVERVDVRVIAATSRDLPAMVAEGRFRADLYYRLNVLPIRLPPLRERLADLDALADHLLEDIARRTGLPAPKILTADAVELLATQPWPGNIRELRNVLEQACLMSDELVLSAALITRPLAAERAESGAPAAPPPATNAAGAVPAGLPLAADVKPLAEAVAELEARAIRAALDATKGNKLAAARMLGIARATLYEKMGQIDQRAACAGPV